jgi:hypothetical protein
MRNYCEEITLKVYQLWMIFLFVQTRDIGYRIDTTHSMAREADLLLLLLLQPR